MTRALAAVACLVALAFAGCAGDSGGNDIAAGTGKTVQTIGDGTTPDAVAGNGEIRGVVQDDIGLPVEGALVSLLGTESSALADAAGAFRFANVTAGAHVVRVTPDDIYRIHEGKVTVNADRVTEVTITLVPIDDRGPGYRPHIHDYWGDRTELVLTEEALDWAGSPGCSSSYTRYGLAGEALTGGYQPNNDNWWLCFGVVEMETGRPPIVLPGTARLRFSVTWGDDVDVDRFVFAYTSPDIKGDSFQEIDAAAGQGEEIVLDITGAQADDGHQAFSLWQFRIQPQPRTVPMTILGPLNVKVVIENGGVPVDPPHEDFWGANTSYLTRSWETPPAGISNCCVDDQVQFVPDTGRLVPPGAKTLSIRFGYSSSAAPGTPHDLDWDLLAKPANLHPGTPLEEYLVLTPTGTPSAGVKEYLIELDSGQTDAFYQANSNWRFAVRQSPTDPPEAITESQHQFKLEIISHKDPAYV